MNTSVQQKGDQPPEQWVGQKTSRMDVRDKIHEKGVQILLNISHTFNHVVEIKWNAMYPSWVPNLVAIRNY